MQILKLLKPFGTQGIKRRLELRYWDDLSEKSLYLAGWHGWPLCAKGFQICTSRLNKPQNQYCLELPELCDRRSFKSLVSTKQTVAQEALWIPDGIPTLANFREVWPCSTLTPFIEQSQKLAGTSPVKIQSCVQWMWSSAMVQSRVPQASKKRSMVFEAEWRCNPFASKKCHQSEAWWSKT